MKTLCRKSVIAILAIIACVSLSAFAGCKLTKTEDCDHDWVAGTKIEATYEADGSQEYTCSKCGETKTEILPKLVCTEHDWVAGEIITQPTYETEGSQKYSCSKCHAEKTEVLPKKTLPVTAPEKTVETADNSSLIDGIKNIGDASSVEMTLGEGTFKLKDTAGIDSATANKTVILNGAGKDKTTYDAVKTNGEVEAGSDFSFQKAEAVVFKNMTVNFGVVGYNGIVRAKTVIFQNCKIEGMITYCGSEKAMFVDCEFTIDGGKDFYNMWIYTNTEMSYEYINCTFYSKEGKFLHPYIENGNAKNPVTVSILVDGCTFTGDSQNKPALNVKNVSNITWAINIKNSFLNNVKGWYAMEAGVTATSSVTIDGVTVWADGAEIPQS